jgi:hypothetical protein
MRKPERRFSRRSARSVMLWTRQLVTSKVIFCICYVASSSTSHRSPAWSIVDVVVASTVFPSVGDHHLCSWI